MRAFLGAACVAAHSLVAFDAQAVELDCSAVPRSVAAPSVEDTSAEAEVLRGKAHRHLADGQPTQALALFRQALSVQPNDALSEFGLVQALSQSGAHSLAFEQACKRPELFTAALLAELRHRAAVSCLRQARASEGKTRSELLTRSISLMTANQRLGHFDSTSASDLVVALHEAGQHAAAVAVFERLRAGRPSGGVKDWAVLPAAQSYASLHQHKQALKLLEPIADPAGEAYQAVYALAFVYSDMHRFGDASKLLDRVTARFEQQGHAEQSYARQLSVLVRLWAADYRGAHALLNKGLARFPGDAGLIRLQAQLERERSRPSAAVSRLSEQRRVDPSDLETRVALAAVLSDRSTSAGMQQLADIEQELGPSAELDQARAELQKRRAGRVSTTASTTADRDSRSQDYTVSFVSRAYGQSHWRVVGQSSYRRDSLQAVSLDRQAHLLGVESRIGASVAQLMAVGSTDDRVGLQVQWSALPFDGLAARARYRSNDTDVPARAFLQGVTSNSFDLAAQYKWMTAEGALEFKRQSLSDRNVRRSLSASLTGQLAEVANVRSFWAVRAGADTSSEVDVSYFSPRRSWWTDVEVWSATSKWRLGQTDFYAGFKPKVSVGTFSQTGQPTLATASGGLAGTIDLSPGVALGWDAAVVRRPYDGAYVTQRVGSLSLNATLP